MSSERSRHGGVDEIPLPVGPGRLWLCGKHYIGPDPEAAMAAIGATTVVCLSETHELADLPPRPEAGWGIVMGHGLVLDSDHPSSRGSPIYPRDLAAVEWDYVALGHWSRFWEVQSEPVPVVYAGNTACSRGEKPGCVMVELSPGAGVTPTWTAL